MIATRTGSESTSSFPLARTIKLALVLPLLAALIVGCTNTANTQAPTKKSYVFWPKPPAEPHVEYLTSFSKASDVRITKQNNALQEFLYGKETVDDLPINKPYGVAYWNGRIYVTDIRGAGVVVLDLKKRQTRVMGASGAGELKHGVDICITPDGTKYVADNQLNAVVVFDADEKFVRMYTAPNLSPVGVAVFGDLLYIADYTSKTVKVVDVKSGQMLRTLGGVGADDGQFVRPVAVCTDKEGNVYVGDVMKCRIQKFSPKGELLLAFGQPGARPGDFVRPKHMGVASDGTIYVTDAAFNNVQVFDEHGLIMGYFGSLGTYPGAMDLPAGLALVEKPEDIQLFTSYLHPDFEAERLVIVTNQFGPNKVAVYAMGHLKPGRSMADINSSRIEIKEEMGNPNESPDITTTRPVDIEKP